MDATPRGRRYGRCAVEVVFDERRIGRCVLAFDGRVLETEAFRRQGLIDQLSSEYGARFTVEEATYEADAVGL